MEKRHALPHGTAPDAQPIPKANETEDARRVREKLADAGACWDNLCPDPKSMDPARVFRVAGTINEKNGKRVRLIHPASWDKVERHDFEQLAETVLPFSRERAKAIAVEKAATRKERGHDRAPVRKQGLVSYQHAVLEDLMRFRDASGGTPPKGVRRFWLWLAATAKSWTEDGFPADWIEELAPMAGVTMKEARNAASDAAKRMRESEAGKKRSYGGREVDPRCTYKSSTIVEALGITTEMARHHDFRLLVPEDMKAERSAERSTKYRRNRGVKPLSAIRSRAEVLADEAVALRAEGLSVAEIARRHGCCQRTVYTRLAARRLVCEPAPVQDQAPVQEPAPMQVHVQEIEAPVPAECVTEPVWTEGPKARSLPERVVAKDGWDRILDNWDDFLAELGPDQPVSTKPRRRDQWVAYVDTPEDERRRVKAERARAFFDRAYAKSLSRRPDVVAPEIYRV